MRDGSAAPFGVWLGSVSGILKWKNEGEEKHAKREEM